MKRRNFLSESGRWLLLGSLIGTSGLLMYRRQFGNPENCFQNPFCKSCNQFKTCKIVANLDPTENENAKRK